MKLLYILVLCSLIGATAATAQIIPIDGPTDSAAASEVDPNARISPGIDVINGSAGNIQWFSRLKENTMPQGWDIQFCSPDLCHVKLPETWTSDLAISAPGDTALFKVERLSFGHTRYWDS